MQVTIHVPRSAIRSAIHNPQAPDPWNAIATATIGVPSLVFLEYLEIGEYEDRIIVNLPRSARRAMDKYMNGKLDTGVRFRITIPDKE